MRYKYNERKPVQKGDFEVPVGPPDASARLGAPGGSAPQGPPDAPCRRDREHAEDHAEVPGRVVFTKDEVAEGVPDPQGHQLTQLAHRPPRPVPTVQRQPAGLHVRTVGDQRERHQIRVRPRRCASHGRPGSAVLGDGRPDPPTKTTMGEPRPGHLPPKPTRPTTTDHPLHHDALHLGHVPTSNAVPIQRLLGTVRFGAVGDSRSLPDPLRLGSLDRRPYPRSGIRTSRVVLRTARGCPRSSRANFGPPRSGLLTPRPNLRTPWTSTRKVRTAGLHPFCIRALQTTHTLPLNPLCIRKVKRWWSLQHGHLLARRHPEPTEERRRVLIDRSKK